MQKRGQITIFVIIGVILLLIVGTFLFFKEDVQKKELILNEELVNLPFVSPVENFVETCLDKVAGEGLNLIGRQGGYYKSPLDYSIFFQSDLIPYFYEENKEMVTSKEEIEVQLQNYIEENLPFCLEEFKHFEAEGYDITAGTLKVNADVNKQILLDLEYPLTISKGPSEVSVDKISQKIDLDLDKYLLVSDKIVESMDEKKGYVCLSCLEALSEQYDINISAYPIYDPSTFNNDIIWFRLKDKEGMMLGGYIFALDFVVEYLPPDENVPLLLGNISDGKITIGESFSTKVVANKESLSFSDNTNLFDVKSGGVISFVPTELDIGEHIIQIEAEDNNGSSDSVMFVLSVTR